MRSLPTRRRFLKTAAATSALCGLGDVSFLGRLPRVSAQEAALDPARVQFHGDIEPLVRFLEETPRERLLEEVGARLRRGLSYRELLTALLLAGVRNIQPRPVGFKFHSVLVVNSAHLASLSSPESDRWLPLFWALDYFKSAQAQDVKEGDWTMRPVDDSRLPPSHRARQAFSEAMEQWDEAAADAAVAGWARSAGANEIFDVFCRFGARDFREIGHKAIYVANSWRTLQVIGWQHAEPVLRSLAYALLDHEGSNPAKRDADQDRPGRRNLTALSKIRSGWQDGKPNADATRELLATLRQASPEEASDKVIELLNRQAAPISIWDALFQSAGELLMRRPGILSLHALTSANALHFAFRTATPDETRRFLLLQTAAFLTLFRGDPAKLKELRLDQLEPSEAAEKTAPTTEEIFAEISRDRLAAAKKVLAYARQNPDPKDFIQAARRLVFLKGTNSHDYKFSSAVLEDYQHLSAACRAPYLAASVFNLRGSGEKDNSLVARTRAALVG
jgi:hypothetical protein